MQPYLGRHKARVTFLALFLVALFRVKTVNLSELTTGFMGTAYLNSNYKRLQLNDLPTAIAELNALSAVNIACAIANLVIVVMS